jgi:hypothetical protein
MIELKIQNHNFNVFKPLKPLIIIQKIVRMCKNHQSTKETWTIGTQGNVQQMNTNRETQKCIKIIKKKYVKSPKKQSKLSNQSLSMLNIICLNRLNNNKQKTNGKITSKTIH